MQGGKKLRKKWPKGTAGYFVTSRVPVVEMSWTVERVRSYVFSNVHKFDSINYIYVLDTGGHLSHVLSIKEVYRCSVKTLISKAGVGGHSIIKVSPNVDKRRVSHAALKHRIKAVPVVEDGVFLGVVPSDSILSILHKETQEGYSHLAGVRKPKRGFDGVLEASIKESFLSRIPWLLFGLFGGILLASVIGVFEETLRKDLLLAAFLPLVVYISNATGMQVQTLFIRDLASGKSFSFSKYISRQFLVSFLIAIVLSLIVFVVSLLGWSAGHTAYVVAISVFLTINAAVFFALLVPLLIEKMRMDPAVGSGPFVTILQDGMSVVVYFAIASLLL